jgi:hypothetical protein
MLVDDMVLKLIEQAPTIAVLVWLVYSLRQDVRHLTDALIDLKHEVKEQSVNGK